MARTDYNVKIVESSKELTAKERISIKDTTGSIKLDEATTEGSVVIDVDGYAVLEVHNEKADNKDYNVYVLFDKGGNVYTTGSKNFFNSFIDIFEEMEGEDEEYQIEVYRRPSKNYANKDFLTCKIV